MSQAGMERAGAERHRGSPKGERAGGSASIEPTLDVATKLANLLVSARPNCLIRRSQSSKNRTIISQTSTGASFGDQFEVILSWGPVIFGILFDRIPVFGS